MTEVSEAIADLSARLEDKAVAQDLMLASRYEPWRQVLVDIRESLVASAHASPLGARVFAPKKVSLRYCFPFAVDYSHGKHRQVDVDAHIRTLDPDLSPHGAALGGEVEQVPHVPYGGVLPERLEQELKVLFPGLRLREVTPPAYTPLPVSAFWLGSGYGLYGGKKVQLQDVAKWWPSLRGMAGSAGWATTVSASNPMNPWLPDLRTEDRFPRMCTALNGWRLRGLSAKW